MISLNKVEKSSELKGSRWGIMEFEQEKTRNEWNICSGEYPLSITVSSIIMSREKKHHREISVSFNFPLELVERYMSLDILMDLTYWYLILLLVLRL